MKTIFLSLFIVSSGFSQINQKYSFGDYGANGYSICEHQGNILVGGGVFTSDSNGIFFTGLLAVFDSQGTAIDSFFVGQDHQTYWVRKVAVDDTGNVYLIGHYEFDSLLNPIGLGVFVQKRAPDYSILWTTEYVDTFPYNVNIVRDGALLENGNIAVGATFSICCDSIASGVSDAYVMLYLFDQNGELILDRRYGDSYTQDDFFSLEEGPNSIFLGDRKRYFFPTRSRSKVFEVDFHGNLKREFTSNTSTSEGPFDMVYTQDDHLILTGIENNSNFITPFYKPYVIKLDSNLTRQWTFFSSDTFYVLSASNSIIEDDFGNYVIAGNRLGEINDSVGIYSFLQSISPQGDSLWLRNFKILPADGVRFHDFLDHIKTQGKIYVTGQTINFSKPSPPQNHLWLVQTDSFGCLVPNCHIVGLTKELKKTNMVNIYPNPAQDHIQIETKENTSEDLEYEVIDLNGNVKAAGRLTSILENSIDVSALTPSSYILLVYSKDSYQVNRFVKK